MRIAIATSKHELPPGDRALLLALIEHGFDVRAAIWHDAQETWARFDAVIVRSCWDYHLRVNEFLQWIALLEQSGVVVVNPPGLIRWNADKVYLAELAAAGIDIPCTLFVEAGTEVDLGAICAAHAWREAVVKPTISASAHRTERRASGLVRGPALVQEYLATIESAGEWSLVYFSGRFAHAVIKQPDRGDFRVQSEFGGTVRVAEPPPRLRRFAQAVLDRFEPPAIFARVDLIVHRQSVLLMEVEVIEPELFLDLVPGSGRRLAFAIADYLGLAPRRGLPGCDAVPEPRHGQDALKPRIGAEQ